MPSAESGMRTRQRLLDAALYFLGEGRANAGVQEIAEKAGVSSSSIYTYFDDKTDLFAQAAETAHSIDNANLKRIAFSFDKLGLGFIASTIYACYRYKYAPELNRIILTAGPRLFARSHYLDEPLMLLREEIAAGKINAVDPEAFVASVAGAYQNLAALIDAGVADETMPRRVFWLFAQMLGYSEEEYLLAAAKAEALAAEAGSKERKPFQAE